MPDSLSPLQAWLRRDYSFAVTGSHGRPNAVTLTSPARTITLDDEVVSRQTDRTEDLLVLDELVTEAIRRWHADPSPKKFVAVLSYWLRPHLAPPPISGFSRAAGGRMLVCHLEAPSEAEAVRVCGERHPDSDTVEVAEVKEYPPAWDGSRAKTSREELQRLALANPISEEVREAQRISFAFGNLGIDYPDVTREDIVRAAEKMRETGGGPC